MYKKIISFLIICICINIFAARNDISAEDREYLEKLYADTFNQIDYFVNENGLPYDVSDRRKTTSISNIGLYMADVAIAYRTGLITLNGATQRLDLSFTSLEAIERTNGFPVTWIDIDTFARKSILYPAHDHVGNLVASLLTVAGTLPEVYGERVDDYINPMVFSMSYDTNTRWLIGKDEVGTNIIEFVNNLLASDTRLFSIFGVTVTNHQIPEEHWYALKRDVSPGGNLDNELLSSLFPAHKNCPYYNPGMEGGGLFMQYLPGIFLKERNLPMGISAKNFTYSQIEFSKITNFPAWGVSSSEAPSGTNYLGWGGLKWSVVTPHASALAIEDFPDEVIENLKFLDSKGARPEYIEFGQTNQFGFTDSIDVLSNEVCPHYLCLDQSMLFLSLANFLHDEVAREKFDSSSLGTNTNIKLEALEPFIQNSKTNFVSINSTTAVWPYTTEETAANSIQLAADAAVPGNIILVSDGVYFPTEKVGLSKSITVKSINGADKTIINGSGTHGCFYLLDNENLVVEGFTITNGHAINGAGVYINNGGTVLNCKISNNSAIWGGGVFCNNGGFVKNCVINNNSAVGGSSGGKEGGGVYCLDGGTIESCTISGNYADNNGGGIFCWGGNVDINNSIIYDNICNVNSNYGGNSYSFEYCCIVPIQEGVGNISMNPLFVNESQHNYQLNQNSPCINAGTNLPWMIDATDINLLPRIIDGTVDIGAYEMEIPEPVSICHLLMMNYYLFISKFRG